MHCTMCGYENDGNASFCISCGSPIQANPPALQPLVSPEPLFQGALPQSRPDGKGISLFGEVFYRKGSKFEYLFLAAFFLQSTFIPNALLLFLTQKPLPALLAPVFSILSLTLFVLSVMAYFKKASTNTDEKDKGSVLRVLLSSVVCMLFLALVTLLFGMIYKQLHSFAPMLLRGEANSLVIILVMLVLAVLLTIVTLSAVALFAAVFQYRLKINVLGTVYLSIVKRFMKNLPRVLLYSLIFVVLLYLVSFFSQWALNLAEFLSLYGFLKIFVLYLFVALGYGYLFFILSSMAGKLLSQIEAEIGDRVQSAEKSPIPVFAIAIVALTALCLVLTVPLNPNTADNILTEVKIHMQRSEGYGKLGLAQQAIFENDLAYSKLLSLRGYLAALSNLKKADAKMAAASQTDLKNAASYSSSNRYLPYLNGRLALKSLNYAGAIDQFRIASYFPSGIPESYLGLLQAYSAQGDKTSADTLFGILAGKGIYYDTYSDLEKFSTKKIEKYMEKMEELEDTIVLQMVYKAVEKSKYLAYQATLTELLALRELYPENAEISYYVAKTADLMRNEQSNYGTVKTYAEAFDRQLDTEDDPEAEIGKKLFVVQMYIASNNVADAEKTLKSLYAKYPDDAEVAGQFAWVLLENKKPDDALKVLNAAVTRKADDHYAVYLSAIGLLDKKDVKNSLARMQDYLAIVGKDPALTPSLDKYLYEYSLKFSAVFTGDEVIGEVEKIKSNSLLYNYLYAIKGWKDKDSDKSNAYIAKVISANKDLGYAYYVCGVNYFEQTVRTSGKDFSKAEDNYLKSIEILPSHVEGYFSIGHCYLKWGKNLEALRAFRKVVDLLPYEDHRTDRYGMTVHAVGMIGNLAVYDAWEGK